ncbi:MAG: GNAT family N-acetyltransferase [Anaerolineaceae bacterium]|nr:MAG: GNAT family N-acetyltransferase [Anaerolineaceae bacterium]
MLPEQIMTFREMITLKDGGYVLLRPMVKTDRPHLDELFLPVGEDDMRYFRHDIKDPQLLQGWCDNLNYEDVLPLLALVKDHAVGSGSLHFFKGPKRHIGEVRLFLSKEYRKRGLGMKIIRVLVDFARKQGLSTLVAEIIADKTKVVRAFEQIGFVPQCTLEDYFMFPDGDCADVVFMTMRLKPRADEF